MTIRRFCLVLLLAVLAVLPAAPAAPAQGDALTVYGGVNVYADPAFDSLALLEFPFSLSREQFEFFRPSDEDSALYARIFAQEELLEAASIEIAEEETAGSGGKAARPESTEAAEPMDPEALKEHLRKLNPEDFGRFTP